MALTRSFKFVDDDLNRRLIALLNLNAVNHRVDKTGSIHYSPSDEELVENELICSIRDHVFPSWRVVICPSNWAEIYRTYMTKHDVPFVEEMIDNQLCFLIPIKYRPHSWKLQAPTTIGKRSKVVR